MSDHPDQAWREANQHYLTTALSRLREYLSGDTPGDRHAELAHVAEQMPAPPALLIVQRLFGLSDFERDVLTLSAGTELDSEFAAALPGGLATFGLALAVLPGAHWSALVPTRPLRRWHLVSLGLGQGVTGAALVIDERILHFLSGVNGPDERLFGLLRPLPPYTFEDLTPSRNQLVQHIESLLSATASPIIALDGPDHVGKLALTNAVASRLGIQVNQGSSDDIPASAGERELLSVLLQREAMLTPMIPLLDLRTVSAGQAGIATFVESFECPLLLATDGLPIDTATPTHRLTIEPPTPAEQRSLGPASLSRARTRLDALTQRIEPMATWEQLVLPDSQTDILRNIALHMRQRTRVYQDWGFGNISTRGLGISALFTGPSGTGKTMAAEVLANELGLDLYRIDLSQVISKYIGETEKNLRQVFYAAEHGGAILLFDEADAIFGKRSEVRDSHDRYANIEVSYLLQLMEVYRGIAILTTNMKEAIDKAFMRRIRFIVRFPFPDTAQRAQIWAGVFPDATPTELLNIEHLAQLNVAGGNIHNIAMNAAFLAADRGEAVNTDDLLRAAQNEYSKVDRAISETELRGWR